MVKPTWIFGDLLIDGNLHLGEGSTIFLGGNTGEAAIRSTDGTLQYQKETLEEDDK